MNRLAFNLGETIQVFRIGDTANEKIAEKKEKIVQTYTFSIDQFNYIAAANKPDMKAFFSFDKACCLDCPFSSNQGDAKCYTHKYMQYSGFVSMIKSIIKEFGSVQNIPSFDQAKADKFIAKAAGKYVRFGSYGEPVLHPDSLVETLAKNASSYTGYTHQWKKYENAGRFFMASTHNEDERKAANSRNYRAFVAVSESNAPDTKAMFCLSEKMSCSKCSLCSGTCGKGKADVKIMQH